MTDTFFNICRHVIKNPDINIDISIFKINNICDKTENCDNSWFYYTFMRDCLYKMYDYKDKDVRQKIGLETYIKLNEYSKVKLQCFQKLIEPPQPNPYSIINVENSIFSFKPVYENLIDIYMKCQQHYHAFLRFANIIRHRIIKIKNQ